MEPPLTIEEVRIALKTVGERHPVGRMYARLMGCTHYLHHYRWTDSQGPHVECSNCGATGRLDREDGGTVRAIEVWFEMHEKEDE